MSAKLVDTVRIVANKHDATASQVAINWCLAKGTVPIPGARNLAQAQDASRAPWFGGPPKRSARCAARAASWPARRQIADAPACDINTGLKPLAGRAASATAARCAPLGRALLRVYMRQVTARAQRRLRGGEDSARTWAWSSRVV